MKDLIEILICGDGTARCVPVEALVNRTDAAKHYRLKNMDKTTHTCNYCGDSFEHRETGKNKYCSITCSNYGRSYKMQADPNKKTTLKCAICRKEFKRYKSEVDKQNIKCCSFECGHEFKRRAHYKAPNRIKVKTRYCHYCGDELERKQVIAARTRRKRGEIDNLFCTLSCASKYNSPTTALIKKFNIEKQKVPNFVIDANVELYKLKRQINNK